MLMRAVVGEIVSEIDDYAAPGQARFGDYQDETQQGRGIGPFDCSEIDVAMTKRWGFQGLLQMPQVRERIVLREMPRCIPGAAPGRCPQSRDARVFFGAHLIPFFLFYCGRR